MKIDPLFFTRLWILLGFGAQLLRDIPFYSSFFGSYDLLCLSLSDSFPQWSDTFIYFLAGGFAGQIGWAVSIVPDVIKSRIQTSETPSTIRQTTVEIYRVNGLKGFFSGVEVAIIRAFPANAALFVGYELTRALIS